MSNAQSNVQCNIQCPIYNVMYNVQSLASCEVMNKTHAT